jgi:hypothetical protein
MAADSLAVGRAGMLFEQLRASGFFGGAGRLYELERAMWECFRQCDGAERLVCFVLANILDRIAKIQESEAIAADAAVELSNLLNQHFNQCMDYLLERDTGHSAEQILVALVDAFAILRK